jgi:hypothetical protein
MVGIGNLNPATVLIRCAFCGSFVVEAENPFLQDCSLCDQRSLVSDLYKSEEGHRPNLSDWTLADCAAWLAAYDRRPHYFSL